MKQSAPYPVSRSLDLRPLAALLAAALLAVPWALRAAATGTTSLLTPQGSGAGTANGDFISSGGTGLDTAYRYFIEVPSGVSRLVVELFDADVGLGGTGEAAAGRDRQRGGSWNTSASYTLLDPTGTAGTTVFTTGSNAAPAGGDNAWLTLYNATGNDVADNFGAAAYSNNDGNNNWAGDWSESDGGGGGATGGAIQITGGELRLQDGVAGTPSIQREADLLGSPGLDLAVAFLGFDFSTSGNLEDNDEISVQVSSNGGGSWTTLETFSNDSSGSRSYDVTSFIANNTRVRFLLAGGYTGTEFFFVDNLRIADGEKTAGHWELRVDMSSAETTGDDINALGIRAHDGTSGSGGTELNVYYDSQSQFGVNPPGSGTTSRSYDYFPFVTSGCSASKNEFDYDSNSGDTGSMTFSSRAGAFSQSYASASLAANNVWRRDSFTGWTSDTDAVDYGIWSADVTISSYLVGGTPNGNYANLWLGNFQAAANPPAANPTTNAFRVYLATDAGAAPVKPYVEQLARFSGCGLSSGPNPPVAGQTSCFTVTVRVVNEAAQAITFSAANLVTANVPGGGAVYGGGAQVSQGSIVSQPAVGGTGDVTWDPGTLAAGATALLSYLVNVTPTMAGQRIALTATPASGNGTRAQSVDETGNTTQSRATYLFGPLCELAVTENLLTQAVVSSFRASPADGGGVLVEWQTASEAGTAGFNLYRRESASRRWLPVNGELLTGLLHAEQGGTYRFVDAGASPGEPQVYRLEEVEAGGGRRLHGPFAAAVEWDRRDPRTGGEAYERGAHPATRVEAPGVPGLAAHAAAAKVPGKQDGIHLAIEETGLYYLPTDAVAAWLGAAPDKAARWIAEGKLSLTRGGQDVAWYPDLPAGGKPRDKKDALGLFFYGEAPDSLYTEAAVYRLERDKQGLVMQTVPAGSSPAAPGGTFQETLHREVDAFAATVISPDPESDYWFWEFLQGNDASFGTRTFSLDAPGLAGADGGTVAVTFHGATATGVADEHRAEVAVNGTPLGETRWTGISPRTANLAVPPGVLLAAGNQVEVRARTGDGAPHSIFYVDSFDLSYRRSFQAAGDVLAFTPGGNPQVTVGGFSSPAVRLLDVQDPLRPRWITGAAVEAEPPSGFRLTFTPASPGRHLASAVLGTPAASRPWSAPALRSGSNRADYLVIAPAGLRDAAERLAGLRRAQGLESMVADLDQIMDEFNAGSPSPHAIRAFLAHAWSSWSRAPRYVAIAGEGTVDYRDLLGFGDNLVPPLMVQAAGGLFPSDNRLGDVDGDGLPEMAVGRIPVLSASELDAYTAKIAAYESAASPDWATKAVMVADATDRGADFAADSERIAAQIPSPYNVDRIDLASTPFSDARSRLLAEIGAGASFLNYTGHGALDRLSAGGLLTSGDVPGLLNGERLPVLTALTCTVNRFAVPGIPALGELLVKSGSGGMAAVWGPTGLSSHGGALLLGERFYRAVDPRLGDRLLRAVAELRALGGDPTLPRVYDLLGDPALRLVSPPETPAGPIGTGE